MTFSTLFPTRVGRACLALILSSAGLFSAETAPAKKAKKADPAFAPPAAPEVSSLEVAKGFKLELIYNVPKEDQGSWVSMTVDTKGRLIASDQYGGLYRITTPPIGTTTGAKVERLAVDLRHAGPSAKSDGGAQKAGSAKESPGQTVEVGAHGLLY